MKYEVEVTKYSTIWRNPETKEFHRLDGPACEYSSGTKEWWVDGKLHRLDGPAIEYSNGGKEWWVEGKKYSETEFDNLFSKVKLSPKVKPCSGKVVIVDGIEYTLS